ncbi:MAG: restriction endonuclease subunit S [Clostridium sp.]|uniref:restriction endonuclease subunit S n=1 Tax=Clostridium sp. TaxID=1506 RepID=UPI002906F456|nr:restriction endonuclease subunit S [Clostridium sp.]MDU7336742.1 restriction endonuclease subunit S [Clostridium sp.]
MRSDWDIAPLGELISFMSKGIAPYYTENESQNTIRVLNQKCNRNFAISYDDSRLNDITKKAVSAERYLHVGDILINSTGTGTAGRVAQVDEVPVPTTVDGHMIILRANKKIDAMYLGYALKSKQQLIESLAEGSTGQTELNRKRLNAEVMVTYPSCIGVQEEIARTLRALDDKIANNTKINLRFEKMTQAIFKSWFVDFKPSKPFTEIVQVLGGGTPKTGTIEFWNGVVPFFTPKDASGIYTLTTEKTLTEAGLSNCNSQLYPVNTVFVTARGTVGKLSLAGCPMAMNQSCYALIGTEGYGQHYVYHLAQYVVESLKHKASGAVFDAIVTRDFESEIVPDITTAEACLFEEKVAPIYEAILNNSNENLRLAALRDALLPRLMSGELSVADLRDSK